MYMSGAVSAFTVSSIHDLYRVKKKHKFLIQHHIKYVNNKQTSENCIQWDNIYKFETPLDILKNHVIEGLLFPSYPLILMMKHTEDIQFFKKTFVDIELELEKSEIKSTIDKLPDMKHVIIVKNKLSYHK